MRRGSGRRSWCCSLHEFGNRTSRKAYTYTEGSLVGKTYTETTWGYAQDTTSLDKWNDVMVSYAGNTVTTDAIGNTLWDGLFSYTWQNGRQLASANRSGMSVSYQYNADGIRTSKTVNGILHTYDLSGSSIVRECIYNSTGTYVATELRYYYDAKGAPAAMHVFKKANANATPQEFVCYFATNLQGDVVALYDEDGNRIASYTYDAWGNNIHKQHYTADIIENATDAQWLMNINPFRYRGYYYDTETGLYYLQSRYYNPYWGRFVNADVYVSTGQGLLGYNMYVYCNNNPVMCTDSAGTNPITGWIEKSISTITFAIYDFFFPNNDTNVIQIGKGVSAGAGGYITASKGIAIDRDGNYHNTITVGGGGITSVSLSGSLFIATSNAPTTFDYQGGSFFLGGSAGPTIEGISVSAGYDYSISLEGAYDTHSVSLSAGVGLLPAEFHSGISYTGIWNWMDWITGESNNRTENYGSGYGGGR